MAVKHGKSLTGEWDGDPISDVTNFSVNDANAAAAYASSSTAGETKRVAGINDGTGSFDILADAMPAGLAKGESANLTLTSDGDVEVYNKTTMILNIAYNVDVNGIVKATVQFGQA